MLWLSVTAKNNMTFELKSEQYCGPLDKLLELIEEKKLEITQISLAQVTSDFLKYIESLSESVDKEILADFLVIASRLVLIKSRALFPFLALEEEEKAEIADLELRLKIVQELKAAKENIYRLWSEEPQMMNREFLKSLRTIFYPPKKFKIEDFPRVAGKLTGELEKILLPQMSIINNIVSVETKMREILKKITKKAVNFSALQIEQSKSEIIVLFLAILYLIKKQIIEVRQESHFSEIKIAKKN